MLDSKCSKEKYKVLKSIPYLCLGVSVSDFDRLGVPKLVQAIKTPTLHLPKLKRNETHAGTHCKASNRLLFSCVAEY